MVKYTDRGLFGEAEKKGRRDLEEYSDHTPRHLAIKSCRRFCCLDR